MVLKVLMGDGRESLINVICTKSRTTYRLEFQSLPNHNHANNGPTSTTTRGDIVDVHTSKGAPSINSTSLIELEEFIDYSFYETNTLPKKNKNNSVQITENPITHQQCVSDYSDKIELRLSPFKKGRGRNWHVY